MRLRGTCLVSRVSKVACWASFNDSIGVGGRRWTRWKSAASSPRRISIAARRVDQRAFKAGPTPTISRTGRNRKSGLGRSANRTPRPARRWFSNAVL